MRSEELRKRRRAGNVSSRAFDRLQMVEPGSRQSLLPKLPPPRKERRAAENTHGARILSEYHWLTPLDISFTNDILKFRENKGKI